MQIFIIIYLINFIFFNLFTIINYNLRLVKQYYQLNQFNELNSKSKYFLINFRNEKACRGHMLCLINDIDNNKIIIYDCNLGVFEFENLSEAIKFIKNLIKSYQIFDTILIYEFV